MAVSYYERDAFYARNDPEHRQASFWHGDAAQALGLRAHVRPSRFASVLSGYVPGTDLRLGRMREGQHEHRPGWDITLSAPKSVSLGALVMGDRRVIRAHDEAVRVTLDWVEAELLETRGWDPATRRRPRVKAKGMVVAGFRHLASRDQDPQLHTHCVLANMTRTVSRPASGHDRFLKHQLSLPVSMISQWWVRRSSSAVDILGSPKTDDHSPKARLAVMTKARPSSWSAVRLRRPARSTAPRWLTRSTTLWKRPRAPSQMQARATRVLPIDRITGPTSTDFFVTHNSSRWRCHAMIALETSGFHSVVTAR